MSKAKIRNKTVLSAINDQNISSLFQEVVDGDSKSINLDIAWDKYSKMSTSCGRFLNVLDFFSKTKFISKFTNEYGALRLFVENLKTAKEQIFALPDISVHRNLLTEKIDSSRISKDELKLFVDKYRLLKNSEVVNIAIMTCNNLMHHRNYIGDEKNLQDKFLTHTAGNLLVLVKKLDINFKYLYNHEQTDAEAKRIILTTLHKLYTISYEVYNAVSLPDIDVNQFVTIVRDSIGDLRTRIPRCDDAFDRIIESIGTLKSNFGSYYKDYIASDNPTVIMENFILDVSKQTKTSARLTQQFRTIIKHYKDITAAGKSDSRLKSLFQHVDANFSQLEKLNKKTAETAADGKDSKQDQTPDSGSPKPESKDTPPNETNDAPAVKHEKSAAAKSKLRRKKKAQSAKRKLIAQLHKETPETEIEFTAVLVPVVAPGSSPIVVNNSPVVIENDEAQLNETESPKSPEIVKIAV